MVAGVVLQGQVLLWAARQAIGPAGIPSGVSASRLQPTRLRVCVCRPSPLYQQDRWAGHGNAWTSFSGGTDKRIRSTPLATRAAFTFTTTAPPPKGAVLAADPRRRQLESLLRALEQRTLEFQDVRRDGCGRRPGNNAVVVTTSLGDQLGDEHPQALVGGGELAVVVTKWN